MEFTVTKLSVSLCVFVRRFAPETSSNSMRNRHCRFLSSQSATKSVAELCRDAQHHDGGQRKIGLPGG
jgi:hypothetical protein